MTQFKAGDKVRCIEVPSSCNHELTEGEEYIVLEANEHGAVRVLPAGRFWSPRRFLLIEAAVEVQS